MGREDNHSVALTLYRLCCRGCHNSTGAAATYVGGRRLSVNLATMLCSPKHLSMDASYVPLRMGTCGWLGLIN